MGIFILLHFAKAFHIIDHEILKILFSYNVMAFDAHHCSGCGITEAIELNMLSTVLMFHVVLHKEAF